MIDCRAQRSWHCVMHLQRIRMRLCGSIFPRWRMMGRACRLKVLPSSRSLRLTDCTDSWLILHCMCPPVRLKRFPQHRSIWQQISEGTQRGDLPSVSLSALSRHVQVAASIWLLSCARNTIHSELEELGLGDWKMAASRRTTVDVGLGKSGRKNWIRAEM